MVSIRYAAIVLLPALVLISACGGDDDDDPNGDTAGSGSSSSPAAKGSSNSSNNAVTIPKIKDGNFGTAKVHAEVSGDKDFKVDLEGSGLATNGFALLTFAGDDGSVQVSLQSDSQSEPGGVALTARQLATGGGWGSDCSVKTEDGDKELKGEFDCKAVEGIEPGGVKTFKVRLKGTFSATR